MVNWGTDKRKKAIKKLNDAGYKATTKDTTERLIKKLEKMRMEDPLTCNVFAMSNNERNRKKRQRRKERGL